VKKRRWLLAPFFLICVGLYPTRAKAEISPQNTSPSGGAHLAKPYVRDVSGAQCIVGSGSNKGDVAFGFPFRNNPTAFLSFTLGPLSNSPGQEKNPPYTGPGSYSNIGIVIRPEGGSPIVSFGSVTVNADLQTGSFELNDHQASGTWNCGVKLTP